MGAQAEAAGGAEAASARREQYGWATYDWANSVFSTTVVTVFLGPYLTGVARAAADAAGFVHPLGISLRAVSFFPFLVSLAVLLQVLCLPVLGALADFTGRKKQLLVGCAELGALATLALYLVQGGDYLLGGGLFLLANTAFGASIVVYNAFLPEVTTPEQRDWLSSLGWALGYLGGGLLLGLNLLLVFNAQALGLSTAQAARLSLAS